MKNVENEEDEDEEEGNVYSDNDFPILAGAQRRKNPLP
jgi:hypothetical protein